MAAVATADGIAGRRQSRILTPADPAANRDAESGKGVRFPGRQGQRLPLELHEGLDLTLRISREADRPASPGAARSTLERVLTMVEDWPDLNEFKATAIPR